MRPVLQESRTPPDSRGRILPVEFEFSATPSKQIRGRCATLPAQFILPGVQWPQGRSQDSTAEASLISPQREAFESSPITEFEFSFLWKTQPEILPGSVMEILEEPFVGMRKGGQPLFSLTFCGPHCCLHNARRYGTLQRRCDCSLWSFQTPSCRNNPAGHRLAGFPTERLNAG